MLTRRIKLEVWHDGPSGSSSSSSEGSGHHAASSRGGSNTSGSRRKLLSSKSSRGLGLKSRDGGSLGSRDGSSGMGRLHHQHPHSRLAPGSSSSVLSHRLSGVPEDEEGDDLTSHTLLDVELRDDEPLTEAEGHQQLHGDSSSSSESSNGSGSSLGSAVINLDQLTEGLIQVLPSRAHRSQLLSSVVAAPVMLRLGVVVM